MADDDLNGNNGTQKKPKAGRIKAPTIASTSGLAEAIAGPVNTGSSRAAADPAPPPPPVTLHTIENQPIAYIDRGLPLPDDYGYDRLVTLVRDPVWLYCYWELHGDTMSVLLEERGQGFVDACAWVLRLHRVDDGTAADMEIDPAVGNWYIQVGKPGKFVMELGLLTPDGEWISLLGSHIVRTPPLSVSAVQDEEWRLRPEDEEALLERLRKSFDLEDSAKHGTSGFLGASRLQSSFALAAGFSSLGSSASGRPVAGSWAFSFQGASGVVSSGSGGFGWMVAPTGAHEPILERPTGFGGNSGPNWNAQSNLPEARPGKTQHPHFKVKLPRILSGLPLPKPSWPGTKKIAAKKQLAGA